MAKKQQKSNEQLFNENLNIINEQIAKRQTKWNLTSIPSISFEDVAQILRLHIYNKIHLYNPKKAKIENWLNAVITHQIKNILRNLYMNFNKPCISCACSEYDTGCRIYGEQSGECPLYDNWLKQKQPAYNIKLPLPIENHQQESYDLPHDSIDVDATAKNIHEKMKQVLRPEEYRIYKYLFIEHKTEDETVRLLGFKPTKTHNAGYSIVYKTKKTIIQKVKSLLYDKEIDIVDS